MQLESFSNWQYEIGEWMLFFTFQKKNYTFLKIFYPILQTFAMRFFLLMKLFCLSNKALRRFQDLDFK